MDNTPTESLIDVFNPPRDSLTVTDNRTGQQYCIPIRNNAVMAVDVKKIKQGSEDPGLLVYDPGYMNTACCTSSICEIDGDKGMLTYRGYDIEELVEKSSFLEVAFLLIYGRLPEQETLHAWETKVMRHTFIHENLVQLMKNFRYDAHPMGMLISSVSAMATFYPEANPALQGPNIYKDAQMRNKQIFRILGKIPTIAACAYRHRIGRPYNNPVNDLSYTENFLYMLDRLSETDYRPHPVLVKSLEKMWILHAEHELNCSTATMRQLSSTLVDPYTAVAGAAAALYGPLHGGANEAVLRMLEQIGDVKNIPAFIEEVKAKKRKLFGFGHRVYKNYDPRATIMKQIARDIFELLGTSPLWEIALVLEQTALKDEYFVTRKLYPNVDFYSGIIYNAMGFPTDMFPVLFTIPRVVGWLAHWVEGLQEETRIFRPRQIYLGERALPFLDVVQRQPASKQDELRSTASAMARRRQVSSDDRRALVSSQSAESSTTSQPSQHAPASEAAEQSASDAADNKRSSSYYLPKTIKFGVGNSDK